MEYVPGTRNERRFEQGQFGRWRVEINIIPFQVAWDSLFSDLRSEMIPSYSDARILHDPSGKAHKLVEQARKLRTAGPPPFTEDEAETARNIIQNYAESSVALLDSDPVSAHYGLMVALMFSVDIEVRLNGLFQSSKPTTAFRSLRVSAPQIAETLERIADPRKRLAKRLTLYQELVASQVTRLDLKRFELERSP